jgi:hypothetical protein
MARHLYDPLIPPEREIAARQAARIDAQRGATAVSRGPTEQFILSCQCGTLDVTSDITAPGRFLADHAACA